MTASSSTNKPNKRNNSTLVWPIVSVIAVSIGFYVWYRRSLNRDTAPPAAPTTQPEPKVDTKKEPTTNLARHVVLDMMDQVIDTQIKLRKLMRDVINRMTANEIVGIKQVYEYVFKMQPEDPLKALGLDMADFDAVIAQWGDDPEVTERTMRIINGPCEVPSDADDDGSADGLDTAKILQIHTAILERLRAAANELDCLERTIEADSKSNIKYELRTANLTLQAIVGAFALAEFGVHAEKLELAIMNQQDKLCGNHEFIKVHQAIQEILDRFV